MDGNAYKFKLTYEESGDGEPAQDPKTGAKQRPAVDHNGLCYACGHEASAHLTEDKKWRPCAIGGCGCQAGEDQPAEEGG